jgi:hypothetical protein
MPTEDDLFTRIIHYRDESGEDQTLTVRMEDEGELTAFCRAFNAMERSCEYADRCWRDRVKLASDLSEDQWSPHRGLPHSRLPWTAYPHEGPHFHFAHLLGEDRIWSGPDSLWAPLSVDRRVCQCCGTIWFRSHRYGTWGHQDERPLPASSVCLHCLRSSLDLLIPRGMPRGGRTKYEGNNGLKGGVG